METSSEIMDAIRSLANNADDVFNIWGAPSEQQHLTIWEIVTKNGLIDAREFVWGTAGDQWADSILVKQPGEAIMSTVNEIGIIEIKEFLAANHKKGGDHFTDSMLSAWAADAEDQMHQGNPPTIEIRSFDSVSGAAVEYTISDAGVDKQ